MLSYLMKKMMPIICTIFPTPCANLTSSLVNECFQIFLCWESFIKCRYSIAAPAAGSMMELANWCYCTVDTLPLNLYCTYVTPRLKNGYVSYLYVKLDIMLISYCGIILIFFSRALYHVVRADVIVRAGVFIVTTIGHVAVIIRATIDGAGVYTLSGNNCYLDFSLILCINMLNTATV